MTRAGHVAERLGRASTGGQWFARSLLWLAVLEAVFFLGFARPLEPPLIAFYAFGLIFSLPGAIAYLLLLGALPRHWTRRRRRLAAVLLSPVVLGLIWIMFWVYGPGVLVFALGSTAYGLTVPLPGEPVTPSTRNRV